MHKFRTPALLMILALGVATAASAETINFQAMADGAYGESAWTSLDLTLSGFSVSITGTDGLVAAYAYLDSGDAGLGVCPQLYGSPSANAVHPGSTTNICDPSSDDNVRSGETLHFLFDRAVSIDSILFNNHHDTDFSLAGDTVNVGGTSSLLASVGSGQWLWSGPSIIPGGTSFDISWETDQFYVSQMTVSTVPEPASALLTGLGLLGVGLLRQRRQINRPAA